MRRFIKEYSVELAFLFIAIVGLFLLIGHVSVRAMFSGIVGPLVKGLQYIALNLANFLAEFSISDFVGIALVLIVGAILAWRALNRFERSERYIGDQCPKCGSRLNRVERVRMDRLLSWVLYIPLHRYRCANSDCGWIGVKKPGRST